MMVNFKDTFMNFILLGLFIFALLAFTIQFQEDNNAPNKLIDDPLMNDTFSTLRNDLDSLEGQSQQQKTLFEQENPTSGFGTILLFSIVSSGKVFNSMVIGVFNTLIKLPVVVLGIDSAVVSVIGTILILIVILGLWAVYKLGG